MAGGVPVLELEHVGDSGHLVEICAADLDAVAASLVGRRLAEPVPRAMNATCTVRLPAAAGELVQRPRDAVRPDVFARQVKLGRFAHNDAAAALRRHLYHVIWTRASTRPAGGRRACCARASRDPDGPRDRRGVARRAAVAQRNDAGPARSARWGPGEPGDAPAWRTEATVRVTAALSSPRPSPPVVRPSTSASARPRPGAAPRSSCACACRPP